MRVRKGGVPFWQSLKRVLFISKTQDPKAHGKQQHDEIEIARKFVKVFRNSIRKGLEVDHMKMEDFLVNPAGSEDGEGHLICSFGGDGTFIQFAQKILSNQTLTLGINSDAHHSLGNILGFTFDQEADIEKSAKFLLDRLENGKFEIISRWRARAENLTRTSEKYPLGTLVGSCSAQRSARVREELQQMLEVRLQVR